MPDLYMGLRSPMVHMAYNECIVCHVQYHTKCVNMNMDDILKCDLGYCPIGSVFSYNYLDSDDDFKCAIMEGMLNNEFLINEISRNSYVFFKN